MLLMMLALITETIVVAGRDVIDCSLPPASAATLHHHHHHHPVFDNTYFMFFFADFKKIWLRTFYEILYQKILNSLAELQCLVITLSKWVHILRSANINMSSLLKRMSIEILTSKLLMGTRPSSKLHSSFVSAFLSKMFNVGDLPVLTFGNCVMV